MSTSDKDTVIRQRLIELERKHAKALKKLQRAERSKQRRRTFHGLAVKDDNTDYSVDAQSRSNTPLAENVFSPDVRKSSPLSCQKKRLCKSVTFKDTVDTSGQVYLEKSCNEDEESSRPKERCKRNSAPTGGQTKPQAHTEALQGYLESNCHSSITADRNWVNSFSDSYLLSMKERKPDIGVVGAEHKDCSRTEDGQDSTVNKAGRCGLAADIPIITTSQEVSDSAKEIIVAEDMENPGKYVDTTVMEDIHYPDHKCEDTLSKEGLVSLNGKAPVKVKDSFEKDDAHSCSSVQESENVSPQNWHWLHLFEEEFPRRSPRLLSIPYVGSQTVVFQDNNQPRKTKRARSKHSRTKKEISPCSKDKITKCYVSDTTSCNNVAEEKTAEDFVFPRPPSEQTRNGGFLSAIVDFSLPDNEFAKLKLAKIKGSLPVERISRVANGKSEKVTEGHDILAESKCKEEMKGGCSHSLTKSASSTPACSRQVEANAAENTLEGKRTNNLQVLSTPVNLECNKQSECTVNNFLSSSEHQQRDLPLQIEPVKNCNASPKVQPLENKARQTDFAPEADMELGHHNNSHIETCCAKAVHQTINIEKKNKLSTGVYEQHDLRNEQGKLDYKSNSDNNEGLLLINTLQCDSRRPQEINEFSNEGDSNFDSSKTDNIYKTCGTEFPLEVNIGIQKTPEQLCANDQRELLDLTEKRSSPSNHEPKIGDQATPHGKMTEPLETSQLSCMTSPEDQSELSPVLMMACLQHHIEGENNKVKSVSLSSYEPSAEKDVSVPKRKRDILVVCLAHLVVVWTVVPGLQWTVLHKWSLPTDGGEEFVSVQILPLKSQVALLVGGNFQRGNGRILGYSELEGDYSFDVQQDDKRNTCAFLTMCLLHDTPGRSGDESVECVIGSRTFHEVTLTKWTLDAFCLMGEEVVYFHLSSGKRNVKPYQSLTENSKTDTQWFDPSTGQLCAMQANPSMVPVPMNHNKGFFGRKHESNFTEEHSRSCSSKELEDKVKSASRPGEGLNYSLTKIGRSVTGLKYCGRSVKQQHCFAPIITESDLSSLHSVQGSHCLLLGTTDDRLFLWNHKTCQLLQSISLCSMDFDHLSCLKAFTERGFLFLMMASKSGKEIVSGEDANTGACLLFALNPKTSKMICLECFSLEQRLNTLGTNGQYIAAGHQARGKVNIWNITNCQRHSTLQVFQDEVSSIGFHQDRPLVAFGSTGGCVHLFSLC